MTIPLAELLSLRGRRAVVTGGAGGIGAAIVDRFAEAGADVVVADIDEPAAKGTADAVARRHGRTVLAAPLDVADREQNQAVADLAVAELGGLDIWVNNAGLFPLAPFVDVDLEQFDRVQAVNVRGTFLGTAIAARAMIAAGHGGVVVNLASTASFRTHPGTAAYASSKHGVAGLTKAAAVELGPQGIRVLAVAPTFTRTPGTDVTVEAWAAAGTPDVVAQSAATHPLRRVGESDEVARVVLFCASDMAALMTGCIVPVDAGRLAT